MDYETIQRINIMLKIVWISLGVVSLLFFILTGIFKRMDGVPWYEGMYVSIWCLGASILVFLASV